MEPFRRSAARGTMQVAHTSLRVDLTYRIARRLIAARQARQGANNAEAVDWQTYYDWRYRSLKRQFNENFSIEAIIGKDILDFGCGDGSLSIVLMDAGAKSVHGVDLDERGLEKFRERLKRYAGTRQPTFSHSSSGKKIDLRGPFVRLHSLLRRDGTCHGLQGHHL